jgi:hypothetical protein
MTICIQKQKPNNPQGILERQKTPMLRSCKLLEAMKSPKFHVVTEKVHQK